MALDRQSISRRDFPTARRGYDPAAVDAHLARIADEVEALRRRAEAGAGGVAAQTSERVRAIIEAAEASAAGLRDTAAEDARGHVARTAEAAAALRARIDGLERDVAAILDALRTGAEGVRRELDEIAAGARAIAQPPADEPAAATPELSATVALAADAVADEVEEEPALAANGEEPAAPRAGRRSADIDSARIVALERAFSGAPREETDRYLAEHYDIPDRAALLDEVYALAPQD